MASLFSFSLYLLATTCLLVHAEVIEVDVLILGAGFSGVSAGRYLKKNNMTNFLVLEAQNYTGGRIRQFYIGNVTVGEGPNWVHFVETKENPILDFANEINLKKYRENGSDFTLRNTNHSNADYTETLNTYMKISEKIIAENEEDYARNQDQPLSSAFSQYGWVPDTPLKRTVEWQLDFEFAVKPSLISTNQYTGLPEENDFIIDRRGFTGILDHVIQDIKGNIKMEKVVTQIKYNVSGGIEVKTKDGDTYKAKFGLCTFSTGVLASDMVEFVPELPKWKKAAISRMPLAYYTNIFVKFPTAFWDEENYIWNAGSISSTFPVLYNLNHKGYHPGENILLFTAVEDHSLRIESQSVNETKEEVMKTLRKMYPGISIPEPLEIRVGSLSQNPYIRGSFSNAVVGVASADFNNLLGRIGNLYFSGEATDEEYWGYTQGAYFTGVKQAKAILSCLNGGECSQYNPEDSDFSCPENKTSAGNIKKSSFVFIFFSLMYVLFH